MNLTWEELNRHIQACTRCPLAAGITNKVPGQGNREARLMLIGEGPGAQEDASGLAFVGAAGQLLTRMLEAISLTRDDVFIANVVKCRPPGNRAPLPEEIATCLPFLRGQTALIRPQVILLLGATAVRTVQGPDKRITRFSFRAVGPLFDIHRFDVCGRITGPDSAELWTDENGRLTMKAVVGFE